MTATAYLAGPDVFLPNAAAHAAGKVEICRRFGLRGLPPLNQDVETAAKALDVWQAIYEKDRPIFGYSNSAESFEQRMQRQFGKGYPDLGIEGFHLPDNLMIVGAVHSGGCPIFVPSDGKARGIDALDVFQACAAAAAQYVADRKDR